MNEVERVREKFRKQLAAIDAKKNKKDRKKQLEEMEREAQLRNRLYSNPYVKTPKESEKEE